MWPAMPANGLAAEMKGGVIHIRGSAGDHPGAAYAGSRRGMTDGSILIDGDGGKRSRPIDEARADGDRRGLRRGARGPA